MEQGRWIMHLDMDAFFASVEQLDFPEYRGKPLIVGTSDRGVVSTCSYEARVFGVRSAMPVFQARKLCPHGIFVPGRRNRYSEKSREVMQILYDFSPVVEQASIDEAYLDISGLHHLFPSVTALAKALQGSVHQRTGLTCSIGVAPVKFLAKIMSEQKKPVGISILPHAAVGSFLQKLSIRQIPGVGKSTLRQLESLGVVTAGDVVAHDKLFWQKHLGKIGVLIHERCLGVDPRPVEPYIQAKSESAENTFEEDTMDYEILTCWLLRQSERVGRGLRASGNKGRTVTLKIKYGDFSQHTKSITLPSATSSTKVIYDQARGLLDSVKLSRPLRLIGVGVSNFGDVPRQGMLLEQLEQSEDPKDAQLDETIDALRDKFGKNILVRGKLF